MVERNLFWILLLPMFAVAAFILAVAVAITYTFRAILGTITLILSFLVLRPKALT